MKIKWNWGTGITLFIIAFMSFILYMVYLTTQNPIDLVEKDYYPKGLAYQQRIDEIKNAEPLDSLFIIEQTDSEVVITIPEANPDTGSLKIFRPSDSKLDLNKELIADSVNDYHYPLTKFRKGKYIVKLYWKKDGKGYYMERDYYFK